VSNLLPVPTRKHFHLKVKDRLTDSLIGFCTEALLIPVGHLGQYDRVPDMDSYYIYVRSGYRFVVSGQELVHWEARKHTCAPGRDEILYDQG
jgi:hypothetical protein